jgi:hypothetical protein
LLVDRDRSLGHPGHRELVSRPGAARLAESRPPLRRREKRRDGGGDARGVARLHQHTRLAVDDDLGDCAHPSRHDGQPGEHRFEEDDPEPLPARRVDEDIGAREPVARLDPAG